MAEFDAIDWVNAGSNVTRLPWVSGNSASFLPGEVADALGGQLLQWIANEIGHALVIVPPSRHHAAYWPSPTSLQCHPTDLLSPAAPVERVTEGPLQTLDQLDPAPALPPALYTAHRYCRADSSTFESFRQTTMKYGGREEVLDRGSAGLIRTLLRNGKHPGRPVQGERAVIGGNGRIDCYEAAGRFYVIAES